MAWNQTGNPRRRSIVIPGDKVLASSVKVLSVVILEDVENIDERRKLDQFVS